MLYSFSVVRSLAAGPKLIPFQSVKYEGEGDGI